jgi:cytoskeletal protein CcmA (bactofilin family)
MWNKSRDESAAPSYPQSAPPLTAAPVPAQAPPQPQSPAAARPAAIGSSMRIKGEIHAREELFVDGDVEGVVESESLLTVGPNGKVRASIKAREVVIFGSVHGNVEVSGKIAIRGQGSLIGNIKSAGIGIDDGAYFKGSIDIMRPEPKVTSKAVQSEPKIVAAAG